MSDIKAAATVLTDERIREIGWQIHPDGMSPNDIEFARAIEAELLAHAGKAEAVVAPAAAGIAGLESFNASRKFLGAMERSERGNYLRRTDVERLLGAHAALLDECRRDRDALRANLAEARLVHAGEPAKLTDEQIEALFMPMMPWLPSKNALQQFARTIKREVLGAHAGVVAPEPAAWMHEDGRVVTAATMNGARKDGGAILSSLRGYTIPLYAAPAAQAPAEVDIDSSDFMELLCKFYHESSCEEFNKAEYDAARKAIIDHIKSAKAAAQAPVQNDEEVRRVEGIEPTGDEHYDAGNFLLNAAQQFWDACHKVGQYGAVQWLLGDNGALLIYTRGEYKDQLMENIHKFHSQEERSFDVAPTVRAQVPAAEVRAALELARSYIEANSDEPAYGFARPDNPHDFCPDAECCNADEIAAHKAACEAYDRGEYTPERSSEWVGAMHVLRAPWGIGTYTMRDEQAVKVLAAIDSALAHQSTADSAGTGAMGEGAEA